MYRMTIALETRIQCKEIEIQRRILKVVRKAQDTWTKHRNDSQRSILYFQKELSFALTKSMTPRVVSYIDHCKLRIAFHQEMLTSSVDVENYAETMKNQDKVLIRLRKELQELNERLEQRTNV